jgi:hypothetical protein
MLERILFVVGKQNTGKSTQLRSLFVDPRLGTNRRIPRDRKVPESYDLGLDRSLYLRLTSPHERRETMGQFLSKIEQRTSVGRWCAALAIQPNAAHRMPDAIETVRAVIRRFQPESVRVCVLSPDRHGTMYDSQELKRLFRRLWQLGNVECHCLDARGRTANGRLLAGYFDYT